MTARDEILARVRSALATADRSVPRKVPVRPGASTTTAGSPDRFVERVSEYGATVVRCAAADVELTLAATLGGRTVVVPPGLAWNVRGAVSDRGQGGLELDRVEAVVTTASLGIAETGTLVLQHGPGQGRRALSLVPDLHVCVVRADQIVVGVREALAALDPLAPQTWISGPSATSDIELSRVEGVHGPRTLHVVLVSD